jgi:ribonucleoside-diphosphate reductase alpha chain
MADVIQQLRGIACDRAVGIGPNKVLSVPDAIAQALAQHMQEKLGVQQELLPLGGTAAGSRARPARSDPSAARAAQPTSTSGTTRARRSSARAPNARPGCSSWKAA